MIELLQIILIFFIPYLILKYSNWILTRLVGTIGTAYFLGIVTAGIFYIYHRLGGTIYLSRDVSEIGSHVAIAIGIPLLLFSSNLKEMRKLSKTVLKSSLILLCSAVVVSVLVFYFYTKSLPYGEELTGMAIGLYTGGTPNLNAIGNIYALPSTLIGASNLSDMVIGAFFYLFLLLLAKPLLSKLLPVQKHLYTNAKLDVDNVDDLKMKEFRIHKDLMKSILFALFLAILGAGIGLLIWMVKGSVDGTLIDLLVPSLLISVTLFGIVASFNKRIRQIKGMNVAGQYFILVFSFALASGMDFTLLKSLFLDTFYLFGSITIGVFMLHVWISKLFKVDLDCTLVTLTAGVYGPAFVPAITKQIDNDALTAPGLIMGSAGYAIGTFLGMFIVTLLRLFS